VPLKELVGFERVHVSPGKHAIAEFDVVSHMLGTVNMYGDRMLNDGYHYIDVWAGNKKVETFPHMVTSTIVLDKVPRMPE